MALHIKEEKYCLDQQQLKANTIYLKLKTFVNTFSNIVKQESEIVVNEIIKQNLKKLYNIAMLLESKCLSEFSSNTYSLAYNTNASVERWCHPCPGGYMC